MATTTRQVTDTLILADGAIPHGALERVSQVLAFVDGVSGERRVSKVAAFVDADLGTLRTSDALVEIDGGIGAARVSQAALHLDGAFGVAQISQSFLSVDVASWYLRPTDTLPLYDTIVATRIMAPAVAEVYTRVATDGLNLWDTPVAQPTYAPRWDFWGEGDYYREVAALMRIESFTPLYYPGPLVPTLVQSTAFGVQNGTSNPTTVNLNNVQSGNLVVALAAHWGDDNFFLSDANGNTWKLAKSIRWSTLDGYRAFAYYSFITNPGSTILTASHPGGTKWTKLFAFEFSGVNTLASAVEKHEDSWVSVTTIAASVYLETAGLIISWLRWGAATSMTSMAPDTGFTQIASQADNNVDMGSGISYTVTSQSAAMGAGWTVAPGTGAGQITLAFKFIQV